MTGSPHLAPPLNMCREWANAKPANASAEVEREQLAKDAAGLWASPRPLCDPGGAAYPALGQAVRAQRRADGAGQMRPALAPVEAGPAQRCAAASPRGAAMASTSMPIRPSNAMPVSVTAPASLGQLHMAPRHHGVGQRHAEPAGQMVVAGSRRPQRRVARADDDAPRPAPGRRHLHDAFHHPAPPPARPGGGSDGGPASPRRAARPRSAGRDGRSRSAA